jgi:hypothetical protein
VRAKYLKACRERCPPHAGEQVVTDRIDGPQVGELLHADSSIPKGNESWGAAGEWVHADELRSPESLHVERMAEEGMPGQILLGVGDEDARPLEDGVGVPAPEVIEWTAASVDMSWNETGHADQPIAAT